VTPLTGAVNVDNVLLAAEAAVALDVDSVDVARALAQVSPVPGRLQVIATPGPAQEPESGGAGDAPPFTVLVDYAHTPAGLDVVLAEARSLATGRVLTVFGCGGNRDRAKRPLMGRVAEHMSDLAVVTSDNPRNEDPGSIIDEVLAGVPGGRANDRVVVEPDRGVAIRLALDGARPGDVVVIAGKGHETYQETAGERAPFDDAVEARRALGARYGADPTTWVAGAATASTGSTTEV
jgi:UDP-N-acetylmuramoyl-L-alanyl-D-glutamate--2,6-diaminopimelate ligase